MSRRTLQVADTIKRVLGEVIQTELRDPRVDPLRTTVMHVTVSGDLQYARVTISVMGDEQERTNTMQGLTHATSYLRRRIGEELNHLRFVPELRFALDTSLEQSQQIADILREVQRERDAMAPPSSERPDDS